MLRPNCEIIRVNFVLLRNKSMTDTYILSLDSKEAMLDKFGGKGQSLARMTSAGFDVPGGFYLKTTAYRNFVEANDLQTKIIELAKPEIGKFTLSFDAAAESIQALIGKPELLPSRSSTMLREGAVERWKG